MIGIAFLLILGLAGSAYSNDQGVNWVLLVAGSNEYYNYRHQSDICHAYQIVKRNGIPDENIIVMMYDDIAESSQYDLILFLLKLNYSNQSKILNLTKKS